MKYHKCTSLYWAASYIYLDLNERMFYKTFLSKRIEWINIFQLIT